VHFSVFLSVLFTSNGFFTNPFGGFWDHWFKQSAGIYVKQERYVKYVAEGSVSGARPAVADRCFAPARGFCDIRVRRAVDLLEVFHVIPKDFGFRYV